MRFHHRIRPPADHVGPNPAPPGGAVTTTPAEGGCVVIRLAASTPAGRIAAACGSGHRGRRPRAADLTPPAGRRKIRRSEMQHSAPAQRGETMRGKWHKASMLLAVSAGLALATPLAGQAKRDRKASGEGAGGKRAARAADARPAARDGGGSGLEALSDDALLSELAGRRMQGLLEHAFEVNQVSEKQRTAMLALPAIARLGDAKVELKSHERMQLINQIAAGADVVVANIDDPAVLMEHSATLIKEGVEPEVKLLEYWGESAKVQNRLKPIIGAVMKMLDKAIATGTAQRAKLEGQLEGRNERLEKAWEQTDQLVSTAEFTRAMVKYNEAMAVPNTAKGIEQRKKLADEALEFLANFDNPEMGVQAAVRNRMAKLMMVKREYGPANDLFETVVSGQVDENTKIDPPPGPFEQYEARYFSVVAEMMQGDLERARKGLAEVVEWQKANVQDAETLKQLEAAVDMLQYRILMKERDKLKDPAGKKAAEDAAFAVLFQLNEKQPALRPIIAEQIIDAMGDNVDLKAAKPLILQAMVNRGVQAREAIEDPANADAAIKRQVEQAIEAARETLTRDDPTITAKVKAGVAKQIPLFYEKLGRNVEAAQAYVDFIEKKQGEPKLIKSAFDQAGYLLFQTMKDGAAKQDPAFTAAWERFLPMAIDQFGRKELAFEFANRLRQKNPPQFEAAVKYYRMVPANHPSAVTARFREMVTLTDWIYAIGPDGKPLLNGEQRNQRVQEAYKAGEEVKNMTPAAIKQAKDPAAAARARANLPVVTLTQAELSASGDKPDWQRVMTVLEGFEEQVEGQENAEALKKKVMELRVAALMQLKQFNKAADVLIALLQKEPGGRAAGLVLSILQKLNADFDRAVAQGNEAAARDILQDRVNLAGFLVKWAAGNAQAKKNLYTYKVYDADTQRLFAAAQDGAARKEGLEKAMKAFEALRTPEEVAAYKAAVEERKKEDPQDKTDPEQPDPAVTFGIALTTYDLGDWKTASQELKKLIFNRRLGTRQRQEVDAKTGEVRVVPNEQYWEAMYKYYNATNQWAKADPTNADAQAELNAVKTLLRRDYVAGPEDVGGVKWREAFEALRKELIPDLDLKSLQRGGGNGTPASRPAEPEADEPVAAGADAK
jgi:tetratricopeptide (TPR) repeat protein